MNTHFLIEVEKYIISYYEKNTPPEYVYHNLIHVQNVVKFAHDIGKNSGISDEELEILKIAAWFHDIGHFEKWEGHEEISAKYCREFLTSISYEKDKINKVMGCILATEIPHEPNTFLEEIICDADIAHIGSENFFDQSNLLKLELEKRRKLKLSKKEWLKKNIEFVRKNKFFTTYAKSKFNVLKEINLKKLEEMFNNL